MTIHPPLFPFVFARTTFATTPLPKVTRMAVPINSARMGLILVFLVYLETSCNLSKVPELTILPRLALFQFNCHHARHRGCHSNGRFGIEKQCACAPC